MKSKTIWIANDGTEFYELKDCENYERRKSKERLVRIYIKVESNSDEEAMDIVQGKLVGLFYKAPAVLSSIDLMEIRD